MKRSNQIFKTLAGAPQKVVPLAIVFACLAAQAGSCWAAPLIIATSVTSQCAQPQQQDQMTVSVQLNAGTYSFYGTGLVYYFTNTNTGQVFQFPGPPGNPATFPLPAGTYTIVIKTPPQGGQLQSSSAQYNVTVDICPVSCAKPPGGLKAWWPLDETNAAAHDITGNLLLDGLRYGTSVVPGMVVKGAHFNGINDYIEVPSQTPLDVGPADIYSSGDLAIDAWVKVDQTEETSGVRVILEKRSSISPGHLKGYSFYLYNGYLGFQLADDVAAPGYANYGAPALVVQADGLWHFVAVSVKRRRPIMIGSRSTIIVQFTLDNLSVIVSSPVLIGSLANSSPLRIGMRTIDNGGAFNGTIDEVEFFHRFVPAAEWQPIIDARSSGKCRPAPQP